MKDSRKAKTQLIEELKALRARVAEHERAQAERKRADEKLREREEHYRLLAENVTDVIWTIDMDLRYTYLSPSVERLLGFSVEEHISKKPEEILTPASFELAMKVFEEELATERSGQKDPYRYRTLELEQFCKDGSTIWTEVKTSALRDKDGQAVGILGVTRDITERRRAEEALREDERFLRSLFDAVQDGITVLDVDLNIVSVNSWIEKSYADQMPLVGKKCYKVYEKRDCPCPSCPTLKTFDTGEPHEGIVRYATTDSPKRWVELSTYPVKDADGQVVSVIEQVKDVTERKRAEEALKRSHDQLRALGVRLAEVDEMERRRLARELHDQIGQTLAALGVNLNMVRSQLSAEVAGAVVDRLGEAIELVEVMTERIRDVMSELRPNVLDDYGLLAALRWYGDIFALRADIPVAVHGEERTHRPSREVETALFRIAQEALANVAKHAHASRVAMAVEETDAGVRLTIADDGVGFEPTHIDEQKKTAGWGHIIMGERAGAVGGEVRVQSAPGKGTQVIVECGIGSADRGV